MNNILRGTITLASGAGAARAISIISIPILTRLYQPEEFGILALYMSVSQILVPLATLRYLTAIPLPRSDITAFAILSLSIALALFFTLILFAVMAAFGEPLLDYFAMDALVPYALMLPLGILTASLFETFTMWATRHRAYRIIASTQIWQASLGEGLKILLGLSGASTFGLLVGQICGHIGGLRNLVSRFWSDFFRMAPRLRRDHMRLVVLRFRGFPLTRMPAQLLLALALQAPLLLMAAHFDVATTGQMGVAMMAFATPFALIGQASSRAYFAEAARIGAARTDQILLAVRSVMVTLGLLALPVAAILFFFAEALAAFFLGDDWAQAGRFISSLALALVPQFLSAPVLRTLDVLEAHVLIVGLHLTRLVVVYLAFTTMARMGATPEQAVLTYSCALTAHYLVQVTVVYLTLMYRKMESA